MLQALLRLHWLESWRDRLDNIPWPWRASLEHTGVREQHPNVRDELPSPGKSFQVCPGIVARRDVQHHLRPEFREDLPPEFGVWYIVN